MNDSTLLMPPEAPGAQGSLPTPEVLAANQTEVPFLSHQCLPEILDEQLRKTPDSCALVFGDRTLTYAELHGRANALALQLRQLGIGPDACVAVLMDRSLEMMIGLLAIWKAGGAYVPLDPSYPRERVKYMLSDSGARIVLTQRALVDRFELQTADHRVLCVEEQTGASEAAPMTDLASHHLAYVIYTSGSTGQPKGVMLTQRNVANFFVAMDRELGAEPGVWLAVTSISFDISVLELFWTLARGFKVVIQPGGSSTLAATEGTTVPEQIKRHGVTHFQCTPSLLKGLLSDPHTAPVLSSLKRLLLGGEALPISLAKQVHALNPSGFFNMYGPTETTVWSTVQKIECAPEIISIGHPIANTQVHILDEKLQPVPQGAEGEILIGGDGVARGYLNRPELTAERFVPDPFRPGTSNRLYRTGDLGRWLPDGTLQCIGRIDNQVKIRGQRIELGEIESALHRCAGVQEAVVVAREEQLAAYIIPATGMSPRAEDLRNSLKQVLSEAMVPSAFVLLDRFPLTPNGKIDRKALPAPKSERSVPTLLSPGSGSQLEQQISQIWAELLGVNAASIGLHQNFFDLGGHSLLVVQMQTQLREKLGTDLPLAQLFQYTTPSALAAHLGGGNASTTNAALNRGQMKKKGFRQQVRSKAEVTV